MKCLINNVQQRTYKVWYDDDNKDLLKYIDLISDVRQKLSVK